MKRTRGSYIGRIDAEHRRAAAIQSRRGRMLQEAVGAVRGDGDHADQWGALRAKLCRAIVKATTPGRQTRKQIVALERRAQKAFGDVCRRVAE